MSVCLSLPCLPSARLSVRHPVSMSTCNTSAPLGWIFMKFYIWLCVDKKNQLDATEWFIALIKYSTYFRHFYAHHQELETICMLLPPTVCSALIAGCRRSGAEQQAMRPGWGMLHFAASLSLDAQPGHTLNINASNHAWTWTVSGSRKSRLALFKTEQQRESRPAVAFPQICFKHSSVYFVCNCMKLS